MKVICISGKAQNGKDTTASFMKQALEDKGQRVLIAHFGDLVKYICKTFFGWDGQKDERGRTLLQYVGTDKIRAVSPDYWVDFIVNILTIFKDEWDYVLIPDCRFPNEYEIFLHYGLTLCWYEWSAPDLFLSDPGAAGAPLRNGSGQLSLRLYHCQ